MDSSEDPFIIPELKKLVKYYDVTIIACIRMKNIAFIKRDLKKVIGKEIPVYQYREHRKNLFQKWFGDAPTLTGKKFCPKLPCFMKAFAC